MRILYMMHVDWNWIKQRPHYLAELINNTYDVKILYDKSYKKNRLSVNTKVKDLKVIPFFRIPGEYSYKFIRKINTIRRKIKIKFEDIKDYNDILWISYPTMVDSIPRNYKGKIIYDCMDDHVAMASTKARQIVEDSEKKLVSIADIILFSSEQLKKSLCEKYKITKKTFIVRNGFISSDFIKSDVYHVDTNKINLCYFGTVSTWFDWNTINYALNQINNLIVHVIGPVNNVPSNLNNSRIIFHGPIDHDKLRDYVQEMDCFIMPFIINDIILAVDPVKLYEYILFEKNIIVPLYPEIKRFSKYVRFYSTKEEFVEQIQDLKKSDFQLTYSKNEAYSFLVTNSWKARTEQIDKLIKDNLLRR